MCGIFRVYSRHEETSGIVIVVSSTGETATRKEKRVVHFENREWVMVSQDQNVLKERIWDQCGLEHSFLVFCN